MTITVADVEIFDTVAAYSLEEGDQIIVEGDLLEIRSILETEDLDEVLIRAYSHDEGDLVSLSLFADDEYPLWTV